MSSDGDVRNIFKRVCLGILSWFVSLLLNLLLELRFIIKIYSTIDYFWVEWKKRALARAEKSAKSFFFHQLLLWARSFYGLWEGWKGKSKQNLRHNLINLRFLFIQQAQSFLWIKNLNACSCCITHVHRLLHRGEVQLIRIWETWWV